MPKDEFDAEDPLELNGVVLATEEDTSRDMAECFVEEFVMLGYHHEQLLALFRNPHYLGPNMVLQNKGELFVKEIIREVFARWGKTIDWRAAGVSAQQQDPSPQSVAAAGGSHGLGRAAPGNLGHQESTDPFGTPAPAVNL